jgi:prepilin-type N-terminal cleavage/methylation domain-containing protein
MNRVTNVGGEVMKRGFTLMELLVVIGVIAILAAIVVVALNPSRQFAQARNTEREASVSTILNAIGQNVADNKGTFTCAGVTVDTATSTIGSGSGNANLGSCLVPTYIPSAIPVDPNGGTDANTKFTVSKDSLGRFMVCSPEHGQEASLSGVGAYCLVR